MVRVWRSFRGFIGDLAKAFTLGICPYMVISCMTYLVIASSQSQRAIYVKSAPRLAKRARRRVFVGGHSGRFVSARIDSRFPKGIHYIRVKVVVTRYLAS